MLSLPKLPTPFSLPPLSSKSTTTPPRSTPSKHPQTNMSSSLTLTSDHHHQDYDRLKEVKQFDDSKLGVKGLLDTGLASSSSIPLIFHHPPESRPGPTPSTRPTPTHHSVPIIDLSAPKPIVAEQIKLAASTVGFFQVTNHDIPVHVIRRTLAAVKSFNELPTEIKMAHYHREMGRGVTFSTNVDLYQSKAASWRDTLQMRVSPVPPNPSDIPEAVRAELLEWNKEVEKIGERFVFLLDKYYISKVGSKF